MRIVVGVIASEEPPYRRLIEQGLRKTWGSASCAGTEVIYYYGGLSSLIVDGDKVFFPFPETYGNIGRKTIAFFEWLLASKPFDYVFRTNCSSYVNLTNLTRFLSSAPRTRFCSAILGKHGTRPFLSGCGYALSRDMAQLVVSNRNRWDHHLVDDVAISLLLQDAGATLQLGRRQDFESVDQVAGVDASHYHYRCKTFDGSNRHNDCEIMARIHQVVRKS